MELASRYLPRPGWNVTQPAKQTDLITGRVSYNKSGGKLTDQEKRKLKALKEFNKASERDVKQFYKNSKESSRQFAKNINNLSKESKMLLKAAL
jgi:hypothetical protein